ncbi:hypothetical protein Q8A73_013609 [Channa argus]|nr:hypothetical protein Q8A73_013609 [Channa argus]
MTRHHLEQPPYYEVKQAQHETQTLKGLLKTFSQCVAVSLLSFVVVSLGGGIEANSLNKLPAKPKSDIGLKLDSLEAVAEVRMVDKITAFVDNLSRPPFSNQCPGFVAVWNEPLCEENPQPRLLPVLAQCSSGIEIENSDVRNNRGNVFDVSFAVSMVTAPAAESTAAPD